MRKPVTLKRLMVSHFTLITVLLAMLWSLPVVAQPQPVFEAYADAREVLINSYFEVSFTLKNGDGRNFKAPSFRDFTVVSGPSRSMSTSIVNGQISREMSFSYSLKPRRLGRLTIGSAAIEVNGKTLRTDPIEIFAVEGNAGAEGAGEQFFIRAELTTTEAYVGQQVNLDYKLYTTIDIESYNVLEESDYPGFYVEDLRQFDGRIVREVIDGHQYTTKILKRVALFPQQAGRFTIDPLQLQLGVIEEGGRRSNSFFFNRKIRRLLTQSEPVDIVVRSLPAGAPPSFTGAVGQFEMTSTLSRTTVTTDDVISVKIEITGNGDIKRVLPPDIAFPDTFEVYEPKIIEETTREVQGRLISAKTIEYLALPGVPGSYELQPVFSYFDPDSIRYITLSDQRYAVKVRPGSRRPAPGISRPGAASEADIRFIKLDDNLQRTGRGFFASPGFWVLSLMPLLLLGSVVVIRRFREKRKALDPGLLRRRRAEKIARRRLGKAYQYLDGKQPLAFYDEASKAMLGYVGDKLQIPLSELSKENVREKLCALQVPEATTERFLTVINNCEIALYSGKDNAEAMNATYENAVAVLAAVEQQVK
jgi:hypothetical protein